MSAFLFLLLLKNALAQALPSADVDQVQPAEPDSAGLLTDVDPALRVELRRRLLALSLPGEEEERRYRLVEGLADQDLAYFLAHEGESDPVLLRQILVQVERLLAENPSHPNAPDAAWLAARIRDDLGDTSEEPFLRVALSWPTSPYAARAWSHLGDLRIAAWEPVWRAADPGFPAMPLWDQAWEAYRAAWPDEDAGREEHAAVQLTQLAVAVGKPELALPFLLATVDRYGREHPGVLHQN
ncbi:MAG TPA: hypothetical protein PKW90_11975, partial [Myxococcota bacterium]|nr:hypothetical protein [Myxococcota bacterium]